MNESLLKIKSDRRVWLLLLIVLLVAVLGFRAIPDGLALTLVSKLGFWVVLAAFLIWVRAFWQTFRPDIRSWDWKAGDWTSRLIVVAAGVVLLSHEQFGFKIVMDELMLLGTSMSMHLDKTVFTPLRGHDINGAFALFDGFVDKRPLFFPFLVSLLHDVFGYRPGNPFILNTGLTFVFLGLVFIAGRALAGRVAGWLAVVLFAGLPLLAHNSTGGGFELLNLTMILATILLGARWAEKRDEASLTAFCYGGLLLAQVRYESVIFLLPVAILVLYVWVQKGHTAITWPVLVAPLLALHLPLHHRVFQIRESSWEMASKPGYSEPFSINYITENLQHAVVYFFGSRLEQPNSIVLSVLGFAAVPFGVLLVVKRLRALHREPPISLAVTVFSLGFAAHFLVLMCYFWGKFDDPVIRRLSLPAHLGLVLAIIVILPHFRSGRVVGTCLGLAGVGLFGYGIPSMAAHAYSQVYLPGREVAWRREFMKAQLRPDYFMIDRDSILWVTHRISATPTSVAITRREDLAFHMRNRTFSNIYVFQRFEINPESGERKLRDGDDVGPEFVLEPVIEERLEVLSLSRISRVKEIRKAGEAISHRVPIEPKSAKNRAEIEQARKAYHETFMRHLP